MCKNPDVVVRNILFFSKCLTDVAPSIEFTGIIVRWLLIKSNKNSSLLRKSENTIDKLKALLLSKIKSPPMMANLEVGSLATWS